MADVTGKITLYSNSTESTKVTENLGYTHANVFETGGASIAQQLKNFSQLVNALTTNTYDKTQLTYEVNLDTFEGE